MTRYLVSIAYEVEADDDYTAIIEWCRVHANTDPLDDYVVVALDDIEAPR